MQVAAGYLCSSTRAEFFALRPALKELSSGEDRTASQPVVVGTESLAVMALLQAYFVFQPQSVGIFQPVC